MTSKSCLSCSNFCEKYLDSINQNENPDLVELAKDCNDYKEFEHDIISF